MTYKTYIDDEYYVLVSSFFLVALSFDAILVARYFSNTSFIIGFVVWLILMYQAINFYFRTIEFDKDGINIRIGLRCKKYNYVDIEKAYITKNDHISYATSKKRICIQLKNKKIYISPVEMDEVLRKIINRGE